MDRLQEELLKVNGEDRGGQHENGRSGTSEVEYQSDLWELQVIVRQGSFASIQLQQQPFPEEIQSPSLDAGGLYSNRDVRSPDHRVLLFD